MEDDLFTDDDDSIDAVWLEKDKVIEETKEIKTQPSIKIINNDNTENIELSNSRVNRLLSATSSHSSDISLNLSYKHVKKRRKLLHNLHEFYHLKKIKQPKKKVEDLNLLSLSTSLNSSVASSVSSSMSDLSYTSDSSTKSTNESSSIAKRDDDEVFECCSQSLVFA